MALKLLKYSVTLEQYEAAYELPDVTVYVQSLYKPAYVSFLFYRESYREIVATKRKTSASSSTPTSKKVLCDD